MSPQYRILQTGPGTFVPQRRTHLGRWVSFYVAAPAAYDDGDLELVAYHTQGRAEDFLYEKEVAEMERREKRLNYPKAIPYIHVVKPKVAQ